MSDSDSAAENVSSQLGHIAGRTALNSSEFIIIMEQPSECEICLKVACYHPTSLLGPMLLHLSSNDVWKASYTDESGCLRYKFQTSSSLRDEMTLYHFNSPAGKEMVGQILFNGNKKEKTIIIEMDDDLDLVRGSQKARGVLVGEILRRSGPCGFTIGSYPSQAFTDADGNEYEWIFGYGMCSLHPILIPGTTRETDKDLIPPVMMLKHSEFNLFTKSVTPTLDIEKGYESILDMALLTLGYLERVRKRDVARRKGPAFFGGGSWALVPGAC